MLHQFRNSYPQGSLISELINIDRGLYIVKVTVKNQEIILGNGLAAAETIEKAEDKARERALMILNLEKSSNDKPDESIANNSAIKVSAPSNTAKKTPVMTNSARENYSQSNAIYDTPSEINANNSDSMAIAEAPEPIKEKIKPDLVTNTNSLETPPPTQPENTFVTEPQINIFDQPISSPPVEETPPEETTEIIKLNFDDIRYKTDLEMKRLSWTKEQGRDYLLSTYGKRSRLHLSDSELLEFLEYLENLPS